MRSTFLPFATALLTAVLLTGCAGQTLVSAPAPVASRTSATPTATPTSTPTPTPTPSSTVAPENAETIAPVAPIEMEPRPEPAPPSDPPPVPDPVDPNTVDNADYVSYAWDTANNAPLPGVSFVVADGRIICGITGDPHSRPGTVACTPDTHLELFYDVGAEFALYGKSIMVDPATGPSYLYPDWFSQPQRAIPTLPEGGNIKLAGATCTAENSGVRCVTDDTGKGFFLNLASYEFFN